MATPRLDPRFVETLARARQAHCYPVELRTLARAFGSRALALLFPHFVPEAGGDPTVDAVEAEAAALGVALQRLMASLSRCGTEVPDARAVQQQYLDRLPDLYGLLRTDAEAIFHGDPAARSLDEVILTYPGFYAIAIYRLSHALHELKVPIIPRLMTEHAHTMTGVDIHPGATIGRSFFIDHGTGVVVGETTVIGNGVKLYQGVTLGALVVEKGLTSKRHPTLEDNVVVYSNATILGGNTVIGHDSVVGGNAFLTHSVPPFSMVTHETEVRPRGRRVGVNGEDIDFHI